MKAQSASEFAFTRDDIDDLIYLVNRRRILKKPVYHYTTPSCLMQILASGEIQPRTKLTQSPAEHEVAYFTTNPVWEPMVFKSPVKCSTYHTQELGMARIAVSNRGLMRWAELKQAANIETDNGGFSQSTASDYGSYVQQWLGSLEAVDLERWKAIEVVMERAWVPLKSYAQLERLIEVENEARERHRSVADDTTEYFRAYLNRDLPLQPIISAA